MDKVIQRANALHRDWLNTRLVVLLNSTDKMAPISHTIIRFLYAGRIARCVPGRLDHAASCRLDWLHASNEDSCPRAKVGLPAVQL